MIQCQDCIEKSGIRELRDNFVSKTLHASVRSVQNLQQQQRQQQQDTVGAKGHLCRSETEAIAAAAIKGVQGHLLRKKRIHSKLLRIQGAPQNALLEDQECPKVKN